MTRPELDQSQLDMFERRLLSGSAVRVDARELWHALAEAFPHRTPGPPERFLLLEALKAVEARGSIRFPPKGGKRWDRSLGPAVPTSVDVVRDQPTASSFAWRTFPWHPHLHWVVQCRSLSTQQIDFLRRVHQGFVNGMFLESAPLKYRSLQLTGDEKMLASLATTSLFGEGRLTLDLLACLPDALPLAWEAVGDGGRIVIFENAGPFAVARRVLGELATRPYDLIAYGGGRGVLAALGHLKTIECKIESIHYVGDIDPAGLEIALGVRRCSEDLGLPVVQPASELHRQMFAAAEVFGYPEGWPSRDKSSAVDQHRLLDVVSPDIRHRAEAVLKAGRRIPEEVLGPVELRKAWVVRADHSRPPGGGTGSGDNSPAGEICRGPH